MRLFNSLLLVKLLFPIIFQLFLLYCVLCHCSLFPLFFVSGPCARLSWPSRQLLSARKIYCIVSYRIVQYCKRRCTNSFCDCAWLWLIRCWCFCPALIEEHIFLLKTNQNAVFGPKCSKNTRLCRTPVSAHAFWLPNIFDALPPLNDRTYIWRSDS